MNKAEFLNYLHKKKDSDKFDLGGQNLEGIKSNLLNIEKNEIIYKAGSSAKSLFLVVSGEVMTLENDNVETFTEKEYFGYEELAAKSKRTRKAIGVQQSVLLEFIIHENSEIKQTDNSAKLSMKTSVKSPQAFSSFGKDQETGNENSDFNSVDHNGLLVIEVNIPQATLTKSKSLLLHVNNEIEKGHKNIAVDLRKCTLIDSTFLGSLVKSLRVLKGVDGNMVLVYDKEAQSTLFMVTYMDKVFKTYNSVEEAVKNFA
jgi:anti-sigma B factor antagonist